MNSPLHRLFRDKVEFDILQLTFTTTTVIPDSVKSLVAREQMMGMLSEKTNTTFDMFGELQQSLKQKHKELLETQNKEKE